MSEEEQFEEACAKGTKFHHILNARKFDIDHNHGSFAKGLTVFLHFTSNQTRNIEISVTYMIADQTCTTVIGASTGDTSLDYVFTDDTFLIPSDFTVHLHISKTTATCEVLGAIVTRGA